MIDNRIDNNQFFTTRKKIKTWLHSMGIKNYTIHDDLTVDVAGEIYLYKKKLDYIPVQFGVVSGGFNCHYNNLTSLKGGPQEIGGDFWCYNNPLNDMSNIFHFEIKGHLYFDPIDGLEYLDNYKNTTGYIEINFNEFKKLQALKLLNEKLINDLSVNTNNTKKMKI